MKHRLIRLLARYGPPLASLGLFGWLLTTEPPAPIIFAFAILYGWPIWGMARSQGYRDGYAAAVRRVQEAAR